jgi:2-dehydropantoate 2-reductase
MRIAVMATGAVGGYFGARMAAAGHDVYFIAPGANLNAIRTIGLNVESVLGDILLPTPNVTDDPARVGPVVPFCSPSSFGIPRKRPDKPCR